MRINLSDNPQYDGQYNNRTVITTARQKYIYSKLHVKSTTGCFYRITAEKEDHVEQLETACFLVYNAESIFHWQSVILTGTIQGELTEIRLLSKGLQRRGHDLQERVNRGYIASMETVRRVVGPQHRTARCTRPVREYAPLQRLRLRRRPAYTRSPH